VIDESVIFESWIEVCVVAMLVDVGWELAESRQCCDRELQVLAFGAGGGIGVGGVDVGDGIGSVGPVAGKSW